MAGRLATAVRRFCATGRAALQLADRNMAALYGFGLFSVVLDMSVQPWAVMPAPLCVRQMPRRAAAAAQEGIDGHALP